MKKDFIINLYTQLYFIRRAEEVMADEYRVGTMKTPTHFGIGQEACAVGVCSALNNSDVVYTHHRSHTHYLAKGGSLFRLIAELFGRVDGCSMGRGGSVHIIDKKKNFFGSSPILGHSSALSVGAALAFKLKKSKKIAASFFGEGSFDEGSVWESLNYAATNNLPTLFVCENNLYATETPLDVRTSPRTTFIKKVESFAIKVFDCDGNDVLDVYKSTLKAIKYMQKTSFPALIHARTYRWREHVGPLWDYEVNRTYRDKSELDSWIKKCPVKRMERYIINNKVLNKNDLLKIQDRVNKSILKDLEKARKSPWPSPADLFLNTREV
ncbi:MAG: thiamine pyrophosphate-dependent dehydrogenase E1 component subunit alpha [bacterium]|nr:thiamine pyrophosphate-dependent dehydrogenase E1 component subunit alpha [bacterium]